MHICLADLMRFIDMCREVSDDLKEAIASLMFAAPRCGEFPELREICRIIWKEFTATAVQIHDKYSSGVNSKVH